MQTLKSNVRPARGKTLLACCSVAASILVVFTLRDCQRDNLSAATRRLAGAIVRKDIATLKTFLSENDKAMLQSDGTDIDSVIKYALSDYRVPRSWGIEAAEGCGEAVGFVSATIIPESYQSGDPQTLYVAYMDGSIKAPGLIYELLRCRWRNSPSKMSGKTELSAVMGKLAKGISDDIPVLRGYGLVHINDRRAPAFSPGANPINYITLEALRDYWASEKLKAESGGS
jgi:hypothetical protein